MSQTKTAESEALVSIVLVGFTSYSTLKDSFQNGEVVSVSQSQWDVLQNELHPDTNQPVFILSSEVGKAPTPTFTPEVTGPISVTHDTPDGTKNGNVAHERGEAPPDVDDDGPGPNDIGSGDLQKAGLLPRDADTGIAVEVPDATGPSGYDGLEESEDAAVQARTPPNRGPKRININRPSARPAPDADEVQV